MGNAAPTWVRLLSKGARMWWVLAATAMASDVTVSRTGSVVLGSVELDVPAEPLQALVRDPVAVAAATGSDMRYTALGQQKGCQELELGIPTFLGLIGGVVRACDTAEGSAVTMLQSKSFKTYAYTWIVEPLGAERSKLTYRMEVESSLPVPRSMMWRQTSRGVEDALTALQSWRP
ncbi:MAG: hypothetical protein KTR31_30620 [Myxococcales bacterium]|nr:hypothetical protein [Myxococcales bacterium]